MMILLWSAFLTCAILLPYFLGIERGRETAASDIENDEWFTSADPAAAQYAAQIARRQTDG